MKVFFLIVAAAVLLAALVFTVKFAPSGADPDGQDYAHAQIVMARADGQKIPFDVEVAVTPEQEEHGLMHVRSLPENAGMLFIYSPPQNVSMWMKDTVLPLDMLFVRADGVIVKIATHTVPFDLTPIPSIEPVHGVIELNAGAAEHFGIQAGDRLLYPGFQ